MILHVAPPSDQSTPTLRAVLHLHEPGHSPDTAVEAAQVWAGAAQLPGDVHDIARRTARVLRQAATVYRPLRDLGARARPDALLLTVEHAAGLPGAVSEELGEAGIAVEWAEAWTAPVQLTAVAEPRRGRRRRRIQPGRAGGVPLAAVRQRPGAHRGGDGPAGRGAPAADQTS